MSFTSESRHDRFRRRIAEAHQLLREHHDRRDFVEAERFPSRTPSRVTGFGFSSPTHATVPPAVCAGTFTLNGTLRRPGDLPDDRRRAQQREEIIRDRRIDQRLRPRRVGRACPAATAALSASATSGVESFQRCSAYVAASVPS